jgi:predicted O-methyltransferase YrrM
VSDPDRSARNYDAYITGLIAREEPTHQETREAMLRSGLPQIAVSASEGKLLHVLALAIGARRILEIGTLGGYSGAWLATALPDDGKLITLELNERHAEVARASFDAAGLAAKAEVRVGPALASLDAMIAAGEAPFDLAFIDADKDGYVDYLERALALVRRGGLILADNTLPDAVLDPSADSGAKRLNAVAAAHPELTSIIVPVLRGDGLDGLLIAVKRA